MFFGVKKYLLVRPIFCIIYSLTRVPRFNNFPRFPISAIIGTPWRQRPILAIIFE